MNQQVLMDSKNQFKKLNNNKLNKQQLKEVCELKSIENINST
jgi:hypothetical protein